MSSRKDRICIYFDGFWESDHEKILALLTDDVVWDIYGHRHLEGKEAFDGEIENEGFVGSPELTVDRLIEEGDTIAVPHLGKGERSDGGRFSFAATTIFTFDGDLISHVESYVVPIQNGRVKATCPGAGEPKSSAPLGPGGSQGRSGADVGREVLAGEGGASGGQVGGRVGEDNLAAVVDGRAGAGRAAI